MVHVITCIEPVEFYDFGSLGQLTAGREESG